MSCLVGACFLCSLVVEVQQSGMRRVSVKLWWKKLLLMSSFTLCCKNWNGYSFQRSRCFLGVHRSLAMQPWWELELKPENLFPGETFS